MTTRRPSKEEVPAEKHVAIPQGSIVQPKTLSKGAALVWNQIVPQLAKSGVTLCEADSFLVSQYCAVVATLEETLELLNKSGYFIGRSGANKRLRPEAKLVEALEKRALRLGECLGISPAARKRLRIKVERKVSGATGSLAELRQR